jgi:hypothetical protein
MDGEVEHPERQAEDALRAAMRKLDAEAADQLMRDNRELAAEVARLQNEARPKYPPYPACDGGPDCQCPFHWHIRANEANMRASYGLGVPLPVEEAALREHRRRLAEGWHDGACTGCGTENEQVKGPAGAELCQWCDELRIMAPAPLPPRPVPAPRRERHWDRATAMAIVFSGCALMAAGQHLIGLLVWIAGVIYRFKLK